MITILSVSGLVPTLGQSLQVTSDAPPRVNPVGWTSATVCGNCHQSIYKVWRNSLHAQAWSSPVFQASYKRSIDRIRKAVTLELVGYEWLGDRAWVSVKVTNEGSGHCFPTGLPNHRAVLEVTIHDGSRFVGRREIPFEVVMLDENGRPLKREHEILAHAAAVRSDSRLKPNEARTIDISFRDIKATRLDLSAQPRYTYSTEALVGARDKRHIEPVEMKFLVASRRHTMMPLGG